MNRGYQYQKAKAVFLKRHELHGGWWECWKCGVQTQLPELDHIKRTGMGGSPQRLMDEANWQLLCNPCHTEKDGGMKAKT